VKPERSRLKIISVPHTGSNFLKKLLGVGYKHAKAFFEYGDPEGRRRYPVLPDVMVVPLRHPEDNWQSWVRRYDGSDAPWVQNHYNQWKCLERLYNEGEEMIFVPLDVPDRELYLDALRKHVGKKLLTDWEPVNSTGRKKKEFKKDLSYVWDISFIKEIYGGVT
jgi:hypothetical protein